MIPNVGNMSFYMSTMICDFASEILNQFALLASNSIRKKNNKQIIICYYYFLGKSYRKSYSLRITSTKCYSCSSS